MGQAKDFLNICPRRAIRVPYAGTPCAKMSLSGSAWVTARRILRARSHQRSITASTVRQRTTATWSAMTSTSRVGPSKRRFFRRWYLQNALKVRPHLGTACLTSREPLGCHGRLNVAANSPRTVVPRSTAVPQRPQGLPVPRGPLPEAPDSLCRRRGFAEAEATENRLRGEPCCHHTEPF